MLFKDKNKYHSSARCSYIQPKFHPHEASPIRLIPGDQVSLNFLATTEDQPEQNLPILEAPHMQAIYVVHADKNPFFGIKDR